MILETALMCMALNMYHEAKNQSMLGQLAVGQVVMNRVEDKRFPDNVCDVITEAVTYKGTNKPVLHQCQFSWWCDGKSDQPREHNSLRTSKALAELMLKEGHDITVIGNEATHYHSNDVHPYWANDLHKIRRIGKHIFYKKKNNDEWLRPRLRPNKIN